MGQDPNQPYSGQYGQYGQQGTPSQGGYPPQQGNYQGGYQQQPGSYPPPSTNYQQPNSGYQYQQQQPYGQTGMQYNTAHPNGSTSMNMDPNTAAGLSYLGWWVTGLIFYLGEKQNRFVRFHAMQSILTSAALIVIYVVLGVVLALPYIGIIGCVLWPLFGLAQVGLWIYLMIQGFQGNYVKLPIVGDYAERIVNNSAPMM